MKKIDVVPNVVIDRLGILSEYKKLKDENTLASEKPELCLEWHPTKNKGLTSDMFKPQSNHPVWWLCSKCGYEYEKKINERYIG